jgi:catechol 2,3-dioxygenase-like lactoylglutathione lyase family enzyme
MGLAESEAQEEHACGGIPQGGSLQMVLADIHRRSFRIAGSPLRATVVLVAAVSLIVAARAAPAMADLGPCITAAPTTRDVHLFVSNVDRAARWYRDNAGLTELHRWIDQTFNGATLVSMQRGLAGVTLVGSPRDLTGGFRDPQMVCLVLGGPPAPATGTKPLFLVDPDGTSVELPPVPTHLSITP